MIEPPLPRLTEERRDDVTETKRWKGLYLPTAVLIVAVSLLAFSVHITVLNGRLNNSIAQLQLFAFVLALSSVYGFVLWFK